MKSAICISVIIAALGCFQAPARQTELLPSDKGPMGTLKREGCNAGWLADSMKKSGILESQVNGLRKGYPVQISEKCAEVPPLNIRRETAQVLRHLRERREARQRIAVLRIANQKIRGDLVKAAKVAKSDEKEKTELYTQLATAQWKLLLLQESQGNRFNLLGFSLVATVFLVGIVREWYVRKYYVVQRKVISRNYHGKKVQFELIPQRYACGVPGCHEKGLLPPHFLRHIERVHPNLRLTVTYRNVTAA